jgi:hypothetical protein
MNTKAAEDLLGLPPLFMLPKSNDILVKVFFG